MKSLLYQCSGNNVFTIRNSTGRIFTIIGRKPDINSCWEWMQTEICNHNTSKDFVIIGTLLHTIPPHVMRIFKQIQLKH